MENTPCKIELTTLHMHCKTLLYTDEYGTFSMVVEDTPSGDLLVWELDVEGDELRKRNVLQNVEDFLQKKQRKLNVAWGASR